MLNRDVVGKSLPTAALAEPASLKPKFCSCAGTGHCTDLGSAARLLRQREQVMIKVSSVVGGRPRHRPVPCSDAPAFHSRGSRAAGLGSRCSPGALCLISSQTCRDKLKCPTEPTAALWWLLGRTTRVGTGQTNLHTSTQEAHLRVHIQSCWLVLALGGMSAGCPGEWLPSAQTPLGPFPSFGVWSQLCTGIRA